MGPNNIQESNEDIIQQVAQDMHIDIDSDIPQPLTNFISLRKRPEGF